MSAVIEKKPKVLLVEPSSTMRHVLKNYAEEAGYLVETHSAYADAEGALKEQFDTFDSDYGCLLLGWPPVRDRDSTRLLSLLEGVDYHDLPVVVLSQDMRADSRAWVAARNHSVMLRWKDYQSVSGLMENLLDQGMFDVESDSSVKSSNSDIKLLVVDDSASIRYTLKDLFELHGYAVTVTGSYSEAVTAAATTTFDIALLDYYLDDSTGDDLCRELIENDTSGELICAILTGTYSDHIIKRSLRAGAVECMFKNESSELLLTRINALSRVVRQRNSLAQQRQTTDTIIDSIGGSVLVFDTKGVITYFNQTAMSTLGHNSDFTMMGRQVAECVSGEITSARPGIKTRGVFSASDRPPIDVTYTCSEFKPGGDSQGTIVVFRTREQLAEEARATGSTPSAADVSVVDQSAVQGAVQGSVQGTGGPPPPVTVASVTPDEQLANDDSRALFLKTLSENHGHSGADELLTLLMLDIAYSDDKNLNRPIIGSSTAVKQLSEALNKFYQRDNHVAYLGDSKFGILLRHSSEAQAIHLTRKIMQITNDVGDLTHHGKFSCNGALLSLNKNPSLVERQLLQQTRRGLKLIESRGRNNALLIDIKRLLPVYPDTQSATSAG